MGPGLLSDHSLHLRPSKLVLFIFLNKAVDFLGDLVNFQLIFTDLRIKFFLLFLKLPQLLALRIPLALASLQLELLVLLLARLQLLLGVESLLANLFALTAELVQIFHVHLFLLLDERQDVRVELHFNWFLVFFAVNVDV